MRRQWTEGIECKYRYNNNNELIINGSTAIAIVSNDRKQRLYDVLDDLKNYDIILMEFMNLIEYFKKIRYEHLFLSTAIENNTINKILMRTYKTTYEECDF